jgi:hypothetical protein
MKHTSSLPKGLLFIVLVLLVSPLTGCGENPTTQDPGGTPTNTINKAIPTSVGTNTGNSQDRQAPSFAEISKRIYEITERASHPEGPDVGPDGLIDSDIEKSLEDYAAQLRGTNIVNWQGWASSWQHVGPNSREKPYELQISMSPDQNDPNVFGRVHLLDVTSGQLQGIDEQADLTRTFGSWSVPLPQVQINGTIENINEVGDVFVRCTSIMRNN